ncbi:MAG: glucose 1-dehydrogenase [candidate division Zixibacteria bacterium]|nr:glucose 1-dehydrogenase [candidate division Zixibacteria bacterium]
MRLSEKAAIVTGAASGIGRAIALRFAREGACVVVADRNDTRGADTVLAIRNAGGKALYAHADVTNENDVAAMTRVCLDAYGRIDVLVNNAAICEGSDVLDIEPSVWDLNVQVVLKSVYLCSRTVLPIMVGQKSGSIVNIASVNGLTALGNAAYSAAKAGVINLTQNMACAYGPDGIRVNAIAPGTVATEIWEPRLRENPRVLDRIAEWYPLKRVGKPDDIANAALFLASDEASFATGATFVIDGGLTAGMRKWVEDAGADER